ncbi:phosphotransferase enzyme family protein [Streptosporangium sp. NPDC087985]|uniref:phosphotransferase enzyme family protein n=1 Tax=Streptosporangium sp. NPDC087985 TaxID=3366196 RepID=UPI00380382DD
MEADFTPETLTDVMRSACHAVGFDPAGAELLRLGENAIYRLAAEGVVVRIARGQERLPAVEKELCVAGWLQASGVPAIQAHPGVAQPVCIDGYPVSFWEAIIPAEPSPALGDLAGLIRRFHAAGDPPCELPEFDPLYQVEPRLDAAKAVREEDTEFLRARCRELVKRYAELEFALPYGPIHGDAHLGNLLRASQDVVLLDFEVVALGPREWDLIPTSMAGERFGLPDARYRAFCNAYGFDVRSWTGYTVLRDVRELTMTTWLMQNVGEDSRIAEEFALRVGSLREGDRDVVWHPF